jgi:Ca-activated chloride channel homolog
MEPKTSWSKRVRSFAFAGLVALVALACSVTDGTVNIALAGRLEASEFGSVSNGALLARTDDGAIDAPCPLKHTDVKADISGFLARVTVVQQFANNNPDAIEAVYVFPLPQNAAVDDMTMRIGERTVKGKIKERGEARRIYEDAKSRGQLASLLDQERPNIFTQAIANIPPGASVEIEISYVETLKYDEGTYEFSFPMVVGPRYMPGDATGQSGGGWAPDTDQVPDASKISPPVTKPGTRAGHDISLAVSLDAGVPVDNVASKSHEVDVDRNGRERAAVRLKRQAVLPNKDFVLNYKVAGAKVEDGLLTHRDDRGGFFTLILQPPERVTAEDVTPKELVFVLDTSGSMSGFPIDKAKEVIDLALDGLYPRDTFNLITFAGDTHVLFPQPVPATATNVRKAQEFLRSRRGGGGTEMMKAIRTALAPSDKQEHVRIVSFMTDGYVGNDMAILAEIQRYSNARVFSFGVGNSVNRFLLDKMAEESRGEVEYVSLNDDGSAAARRFHERIRNPLLTDVRIDWGGLPVTDVFPQRIPDLFSAKPVIVSGRYDGPAHGVIRLLGNMSGRPFNRSLTVDLPGREPDHDVLATLWARRKVDDLMKQDWNGIQQGNARAEVKDAITKIGIDYRLVTQFTSFVAVEETVVSDGGAPRRIDVPVEMPNGVSYEGVFGGNEAKAMKKVAYASGGGSVSPMSFRRNLAQEAAPSAPAAQSLGLSDRIDGLREKEEEPTRREHDEDAVSKLHSDLAALAGGSTATGITVKDGKVAVEIWLADTSPDLLQKLKALGFEAHPGARVAKVQIGWIPVARLRQLAALTEVRRVMPHQEM